MKLLALDFDGVISDSAREAFVVALRCLASLDPTRALPTPDRALDEPDLYEAFVALMPLGNRAEDFGVALCAIDAGEEPGDQAAYDAFFARQDPAWLRRFHERFYEIRHDWAERDPDTWLGEMAAYPEVIAWLRRRAGQSEFAIATAKDRISVGRLLERYGAADLFPEARILDKEAGRSKRAHLEALSERTGIGFAETTFIDDKLNHLEAVRDLGVRTALAAWGYNGPREWQAAEEAGHLVLSAEDAESSLFGPAAAPGDDR